MLASPARLESAVAELKGLLAADPTLAEAHLWLGVAYHLEGTPEMAAEAVSELRQAIDLDPTLLPARVYLAQAYADLGRPERARESSPRPSRARQGIRRSWPCSATSSDG